jgi:hypothetical protein
MGKDGLETSDLWVFLERERLLVSFLEREEVDMCLCS